MYVVAGILLSKKIKTKTYWITSTSVQTSCPWTMSIIARLIDLNGSSSVTGTTTTVYILKPAVPKIIQEMIVADTCHTTKHYSLYFLVIIWDHTLSQILKLSILFNPKSN
jgi:hypothetical protein